MLKRERTSRQQYTVIGWTSARAVFFGLLINYQIKILETVEFHCTIAWICIYWTTTLNCYKIQIKEWHLGKMSCVLHGGVKTGFRALSAVGVGGNAALCSASRSTAFAMPFAASTDLFQMHVWGTKKHHCKQAMLAPAGRTFYHHPVLSKEVRASEFEVSDCHLRSNQRVMLALESLLYCLGPYAVLHTMTAQYLAVDQSSAALMKIWNS